MKDNWQTYHFAMKVINELTQCFPFIKANFHQKLSHIFYSHLHYGSQFRCTLVLTCLSLPLFDLYVSFDSLSVFTNETTK